MGQLFYSQTQKYVYHKGIINLNELERFNEAYLIFNLDLSLTLVEGEGWPFYAHQLC